MEFPIIITAVIVPIFTILILIIIPEYLECKHLLDISKKLDKIIKHDKQLKLVNSYLKKIDQIIDQD